MNKRNQPAKGQDRQLTCEIRAKDQARGEDFKGLKADILKSSQRIERVRNYIDGVMIAAGGAGR